MVTLAVSHHQQPRRLAFVVEPVFFSCGQQLLPTAGRVRSRRATPTPRLRKLNLKEDDDEFSAVDDGFSVHTTPNKMGESAQRFSLS